MVSLYFDVKQSSHKTKKQKPNQTMTTNNNMHQTNGVVTPSETIIANAKVDRILGLGKRLKEEVTAAEDKVLFTTLSPTRKHKCVTPVAAITRRVTITRRVNPTNRSVTPAITRRATIITKRVHPNKYLRVSSALVPIRKR
jgi:hypothetical protein